VHQNVLRLRPRPHWGCLQHSPRLSKCFTWVGEASERGEKEEKEEKGKEEGRKRKKMKGVEEGNWRKGEMRKGEGRERVGGGGGRVLLETFPRPCLNPYGFSSYVTSAPSLAVFRWRLKTELFHRCYNAAWRLTFFPLIVVLECIFYLSHSKYFVWWWWQRYLENLISVIWTKKLSAGASHQHFLPLHFQIAFGVTAHCFTHLG